MPRFVILGLFCAVLLCENPISFSAPSGPFQVRTELVVTPVTVFDKRGAYVNGIQPKQFHLFDNNKQQQIEVDMTYQPISIAIAIQANSAVTAILPQVRKIGDMITPLVIGDSGEAAVIAYGSEIRKLQDFTINADSITKVIGNIKPSGSSNRLIDAVEEGARMLNTRPKSRRRVLLMIGETRDLASELDARETLTALQTSNVVLYAIDVSRLLATLSAPYVQPPWETRLPSSFPPLPAGYAQTPTTVDQAFGLEGHSAQFVPLLEELYRDGKAVFRDNPVELFTSGTGGRELGFYKQRGLEDAVQKIGEELHSQYIISYSPNNRAEGGFHRIVVEISGRAGIKRIQTRPGYWVAPRSN
jgi:VWFA-related protein